MKTDSAFFTDGEATGVMEGGVKKKWVMGQCLRPFHE